MSSVALSTRQLSVLLVEDNPDDALLMERHLRRHGFTPAISRVETAQQMLAELRSGTLPDVILADYNLPEFSGPAALSILKGLRLDIPFIMLSGAVTEETAVASLRAGAQDYVSKQNLARLVPALERELNELAGRQRERAAQDALRASQSRFHRLVEAMPLGLLISNAAGRITYANGAVESMLGYPAGSLRSDSTKLDAVFADRVPELRTDGPAARQDLFETVCKLKGGGQLEVLVGVTLLNPEGSESEQQTAIFIADLTLQKKSEEALRRTEKLAVAGRLAAAIAHEVNNPLAAVTNCLYLLGQCSLSEESRQFLLTAQSELNRVSQITMQTLRFHRSSTRATLSDLHDLVETVLALLHSRILHQGIEVERRYGKIPKLLVHDGEIRQLIANLIGNAIDALPQGGRIVLHTMATSNAKTGTPSVRFSVADNGVGMDTGTRSRLFEPFFSTKGLTGTGLGLWISLEIVTKQGGRLLVRSRHTTPKQRGGTVFTAVLPVEPAPRPTAA